MAQKQNATQKFVPIREVRDGIVMLKNGALCSVLMASSTNFALKSGDEQQAILGQFQSFLNTLDFSVQILIQSRELDIRPYIALLEERYAAQTNDLLQIQTREYIEFITSFSEAANIMSKNFFIVVPYSSGTIEDIPGGSTVSSVFSKLRGSSSARAPKAAGSFEEERSGLEQRISVVTQGLTRAGVRTVMLGTEEVIELLYTMFNPGETEKPIALEDITQQ